MTLRSFPFDPIYLLSASKVKFITLGLNLFSVKPLYNLVLFGSSHDNNQHFMVEVLKILLIPRGIFLFWWTLSSFGGREIQNQNRILFWSLTGLPCHQLVGEKSRNGNPEARSRDQNLPRLFPPMEGQAGVIIQCSQNARVWICPLMLSLFLQKFIQVLKVICI